jgi:alpha-L-fucosidase
MPKENVVALHDLVRSTQPKALLGSRIGYGMGDYESLGDMEVPPEKVGGLWEGCDTSNDSWAYAWYDTNWKEPREILKRLVSTVARGGNYLLNCGPDGKGQIPEQNQKSLRAAGTWIRANPEVIYGAGPSPWNSAMPWGDITTQGDKTLHLVVFDVPRDGSIYLPGLATEVKSAVFLRNGATVAIVPERMGSSVRLKLPEGAADGLACVIRVELKDAAAVNQTVAIHPNTENVVLAHFAVASGAEKKKERWMEKFGEWKHANQISHWTQDGRAKWTVNVLEPGVYKVALKYRGKGRVVWKIATDEGAVIQNQQAATSQYQAYPMGVFEIKIAGSHQIDVSLVDGDRYDSSLESLVLTRVQ